MNKLITAIILVVVSMTAMAEEGKVSDAILPDTSLMNAKLEQVLQERLNLELSRESSDVLNEMNARSTDKLLLHTMDYFKVDTSLPE